MALLYYLHEPLEGKYTRKRRNVVKPTFVRLSIPTLPFIFSESPHFFAVFLFFCCQLPQARNFGEGWIVYDLPVVADIRASLRNSSASGSRLWVRASERLTPFMPQHHLRMALFAGRNGNFGSVIISRKRNVPAPFLGKRLLAL